MKIFFAASFLLFASGCALLSPEEEAIRVQVRNETQQHFTKVTLDLAASDEDAVVFQDLAPGTATPYREAPAAFQHYTVHAQAPNRTLVFALEAAVAIPLAPGRYTYILTMNAADRLSVERAH